jgi:hypothetical protein
LNIGGVFVADLVLVRVFVPLSATGTGYRLSESPECAFHMMRFQARENRFRRSSLNSSNQKHRPGRVFQFASWSDPARERRKPVSDHARQVRFVVKKVLSVAARSDPAREVRFGIKKVHVQDQEAILPVRCMFRIKKRE